MSVTAIADRRAAYRPEQTVTLQITLSGRMLPGLVQDICDLAEKLPGATLTMDRGGISPPLGALIELPTASTVDVEAPGPELVIEPPSRSVFCDGEPARLTRREFDLLVFLAENPRRVFGRDQLLGRVWGYEWVGGSRTVDVHIRRLRAKLGQRGPVISTVHGVGYRLDEQVRVTIRRDQF